MSPSSSPWFRKRNDDRVCVCVSTNVYMLCTWTSMCTDTWRESAKEERMKMNDKMIKTMGVPAVLQWVKIPLQWLRSLQRCRFDPRPRNVHMPWVWHPLPPQKKDKINGTHVNSRGIQVGVYRNFLYYSCQSFVSEKSYKNKKKQLRLDKILRVCGKCLARCSSKLRLVPPSLTCFTSAWGKKKKNFPPHYPSLSFLFSFFLAAARGSF